MSSNCFVNLFVDAVLGSCVDELGTTRFHLCFGAVEQQHVTFFSVRVLECNAKDARLQARRLHGKTLKSLVFMRRHVLVNGITAYSLHVVLR